MLISLIVVLLVIGLLLPLLGLDINPTIASIIKVLLVLVIIVWLLGVFGNSPSFESLRHL